MYNGASNPLTVAIHNNGKEATNLVALGASWHDTEKYWKLVKNQTATKFNVPLEAGANLTAPFRVHSEFKPKDLGLTIWADLKNGAQLTRVIAFNSTVSVVEPAASWFDPQVLFAYLVVSAALLGGAYLAFTTFVAPPKSKKRRVVSTPVVVEATPEKGKYEEDWIPAIHKAKTRRSGANTPASGGEATSGAESGPEKTRRRKSRK